MTEYREGTLPSAEQVRFEEHRVECPGCRIYFEEMRQTIHLVGLLTEESSSLEAKQVLLDAFRNWKHNWGPPSIAAIEFIYIGIRADCNLGLDMVQHTYLAA